MVQVVVVQSENSTSSIMVWEVDVGEKVLHDGLAESMETTEPSDSVVVLNDSDQV